MLFGRINSAFEYVSKMNKQISATRKENAGFFQFAAGDYTAAFPILLAKAQDGDRIALEYIGLMYFYGQGVEPNSSKAYEALSTVKELNGLSAVTLGLCYVEGNGCIKSYALATEIITSNLYFCDHHYILAITSFLDEHGCQLLTKEQTYAFYNLAAHLGNPEARVMRDKLELSLTNDEISTAQTLSADMLKQRGTIS